MAAAAMTVSYVSVVLLLLLIVFCGGIMQIDMKEHSGDVIEERESVGWLTVMVDRRRGTRAATLKGKVYSLSAIDCLGSSGKADTLIKHPAVEKQHVVLNYKKPGRIIVTPVKKAIVSTSRKEGELMDGDCLILGSGDARIELQLSFMNNVDIAAAGRETDAPSRKRGWRK